MRRLFQQLALCVLLGMLYTAAWADLRVLFRFDASGHHVHSLTNAPQRELLRKPAFKNDKTTSRQINSTHSLSISERIAAAVAQLRPATATLLWFDANGVWLSNSETPDPRLAHSPAHIDGVNESFVSLDHGAWLASGPNDAASVTILFPSHVALVLGFEQWHAVLRRD